MQELQPSERIADHVLIQKISAGSYGEVWLARSELGSYRAVKIIQRARFDSDRPFQREYEGIKKFEPVSRQHDGLVDILHVGRLESNAFYYIMEVADDLKAGSEIDPETYQPRTLASELAFKGPLPPEHCIHIGIQLCKALAFVHQHGLIHRDVKPANIIFVANQPKLADIGLIAGVAEAKTYVGTEGFIAPEGPNSPQADIYSLGKVLYEISTGLDRNDFPALPNQGGFSESFLELNEVLVKACHADVKQRYADALAMSADLELIGTGKSVRRLHDLEAKLKRLRKGGAVILAIAAALALIYYQVNQSWQRAREQKAAQIGTRVGKGTVLLQQGNFVAALPPFVEAFQLDESNPRTSASHRLRIGSTLAASPSITHALQLAEEPVSACAIYGSIMLATVERKYVRVFDLITGEALSEPLDTGGEPQMASFMAGGTAILTADWDDAVQVTDWRTGQVIDRLEHSGTVLSASASPDGQMVISGCRNGRVFLWDRPSHTCVEMGKHGGPIWAAKISPTGQLAVTASEDWTARLWDLNTATARFELDHKNWVYSADFSPDGSLVATASYDREVKLWDTRTGAELLPPLRHEAAVRAVQFSPDGKWILTANLDGTVRIWDTKTHQTIEFNHTLKHKSRLMASCFAETGEQILAGGSDGTLTLWDLSDLPRRPQFVGKIKMPPPPDAVASPDGQWVAQVTSKGLRIGHPQGAPILELNLKSKPGPIRFDRQNAHLAAVDGASVHLVNLAQNPLQSRTLLHPHPVKHIEFSPDGSKLVCASFDDSFHEMSALLWNVPTGTLIGQPLAHEDGVRYATFSPDSQLVITTSEDYSAMIWDAHTGKPTTQKLPHNEKVNYAAFASTRPWVATGSNDGVALIWDINSGDQLTPPLTHARPIVRTQFIDQDSALLTTDNDGNQWKWELPLETRSAREVLTVVRRLAGMRNQQK